MTKKQGLVVDLERLKDIDYDVKETALNIAASITIDDKIANTSSKYNTQDRLLALSIFAVVGKIRDTALICGMPNSSIVNWTKQEWWVNALAQVREINSAILNARTTKIINQAFDNIGQRLALGDAYVDKKQQLKYKPVSAKDNAIVFGVMFDKQRINNSLATHISQSNVSHLIDIKHQFDTMTGTRVIEGERVTSD